MSLFHICLAFGTHVLIRESEAPFAGWSWRPRPSHPTGWRRGPLGSRFSNGPTGPSILQDPGESSFLLVVRMLLVAMPGAPGSVLAPSSKARSY